MTDQQETKEIPKEPSMLEQKRLVNGYYDRLATAKEDGKKVVYTFVPGNLTELLAAFGVEPVLPEINALQSGIRKKSGGYILEAEKQGHSEDVCTYVKSDIGMLKSGIGPTGKPLPEPDMLLLSYTGCFTFMKWFELLKEQYPKAEICMLHVPYQGDSEITPEMRQYVVDQLKSEVIPKLEKLTGKKYDEGKLREHLRLSSKAEEDLVWVWESARNRPSPIDGYFGGVFYIGPIFTAFRGTQEGVDFYRILREEVEGRIAARQGPITPIGQLNDQRYRIVVEGPPNWTSFRDFWSMFADEGAVCVASTYTRVGGLYDLGFRHDPDRPLETLADYCMGCYTNLELPMRSKLIAKYVKEYDADGFICHSVKSCNSFSAGQLLILRDVERQTGVPGGFIESDLVDPRYFSAANIKNRLESYFQMLEQKRAGKSPERAMTKEARP